MREALDQWSFVIAAYGVGGLGTLAAGYRSARFLARGGERFCGPPCYNLRGGIIAYAGAGGRLLEAGGADTMLVHGYNADWARFVTSPAIAVIEPPPEPQSGGKF